MSFHIVANLDQEAQWLGSRPLSRRAQRTTSAYASLLAALAPSDDVTVWTSAEVDVARLPRYERWRPPLMRVGTPPQIDLAWADPTAQTVNDRRFALQIAQSLGGSLPGACVIRSVAELESHVASGGAAASPTLAWVCKAPWSSAGRERAYGVGATWSPDLNSQLDRLLAYVGEVVFEPWVDRICDVGVCGVICDAHGVQISIEAPHGLMSSARGGFSGIDLTAPALTDPERDAVVGFSSLVAAELARAGYRGPFGIDAFVYLDRGARKVHPLCEINARHTFGHVARALARRFNIAALHFSSAAPPDAQFLVRSAPDDAACVWAPSRSTVTDA